VEKYFIFIIFVFVSCTSTREVVSNFGNADTEYRNISNEIREQQSELGITGQRIEDRSYQLEQSITTGTEPIQNIRTILQQVRSQSLVANETITTGNAIDTATIEPSEN
jgi:hypothetical protein